VLDGDPPPLPKGHSRPFSAHMCCGKMAAWIKMPLGMEVGLGLGDFVLDGDPAPFPKKGAEPPPQIFGPCLLWPNGWMDQDGTWHGGRPRPRRLFVLDGDPASRPFPKRGRSPLPNFRPISIMAKTARCIKMPLGMEVGLSPGDFLLDGDPARSPKKDGAPLHNFRPISIVAKRLDALRCHLLWR